MRTDGVSTVGVRQLPDQPTGVAIVAYQADGSRSFVFSLGAGGHITSELLPPLLFDGLRCLHIVGSTLSMSAEVLCVCRQALDPAGYQAELERLRGAYARAYRDYFRVHCPENGAPARFTVHVVDVPDQAASYEFYATALFQRGTRA